MFAYLTATLIAAFDPPTDMEAMQILPESSWSATVRNLGSMRSHIKEPEAIHESSGLGQIRLTWLFLNQSQR